MDLLEVDGLTQRFGGLTALAEVTLRVAQGSIHAVIGPNGSGKTTLFNVISGIYRPSAGQVRFAGRDITGLAPERRARLGLGRTFQNTRVFRTMSVLENVLAVRHAARAPWRFVAAEENRAREIVEFVGLGAVAEHNASSLPQGQRRLLEIAKVLALDPKLVLLDEPHGGLSHSETARLVELIREISRRGITVLLIEHEMDVVMQLAEHITVLNFGSVLAAGTPADIRANPAVVEAYLGAEGSARGAAAGPLAGGGPLLELDHLSVRFGDIEAVRDVSLSVNEGEIVTLLGNNGAGKSTTLKAVCALTPAITGDIRFDGRSIRTVPTQRLSRLGIALVPERRRLFGAMTVVENLKVGAFGRPARAVAETMEEVLLLFPDLRRLSRSLAYALSGGEQQMLAIGRALMSRPRLLLLDEPSLGLAPLLVEQVFVKLAEINSRGTTMLLVEQNARMALGLAHRAYVLGSGRLVAEGTAADLGRDERVRSAYLGL
jgi:ABC-type branched-subunit amino acid transport system ATPase component